MNNVLLVIFSFLSNQVRIKSVSTTIINFHEDIPGVQGCTVGINLMHIMHYTFLILIWWDNYLPCITNIYVHILRIVWGWHLF